LWLLLFAFVILAISAHAHAQTYIEGWAGPSLWRDCSNSDPVEASCEAEPAGGLSAGYQWDYVALEGEIFARRATTHNVKGDHNIGRGDERGYVLTGLVNVCPGYETGDWRFYGCGGIGLGRARLAGESDHSWAAQGGAGVLYALTEAWSVDLGYKYLRLGETEHQGQKGRYDSHTFLLGLRYIFGD
jgi:opacity protein-like surface antigen